MTVLGVGTTFHRRGSILYPIIHTECGGGRGGGGNQTSFLIQLIEFMTLELPAFPLSPWGITFQDIYNWFSGQLLWPGRTGLCLITLKCRSAESVSNVVQYWRPQRTHQTLNLLVCLRIPLSPLSLWRNLWSCECPKLLPGSYPHLEAVLTADSRLKTLLTTNHPLPQQPSFLWFTSMALKRLQCSRRRFSWPTPCPGTNT